MVLHLLKWEISRHRELAPTCVFILKCPARGRRRSHIFLGTDITTPMWVIFCKHFLHEIYYIILLLGYEKLVHSIDLCEIFKIITWERKKEKYAWFFSGNHLIFKNWTFFSISSVSDNFFKLYQILTNFNRIYSGS